MTRIRDALDRLDHHSRKAARSGSSDTVLAQFYCNIYEKEQGEVEGLLRDLRSHLVDAGATSLEMDVYRRLRNEFQAIHTNFRDRMDSLRMRERVQGHTDLLREVRMRSRGVSVSCLELENGQVSGTVLELDPESLERDLKFSHTTFPSSFPSTLTASSGRLLNFSSHLELGNKRPPVHACLKIGLIFSTILLVCLVIAASFKGSGVI